MRRWMFGSPLREQAFMRSQQEPSRRRTSWLAILLLSIAIVALAVVYGPEGLFQYSKRRATRDFDNWALSSAQQWLARAEKFDPSDSEVPLMRAACFRRWGEMSKWGDALESAERLHAPELRVEREKGLSLIRSGDDFPWIGEAEAELLGAGVPPDDVATAFLDHFLARGDFPSARSFLTRWESEHVNAAHVSYLWGFHWLQLQDYEQALARFKEALVRQPAHELARKSVAELLEVQDRLQEAAQQHAESLRRSPSSQVAKLGLARTLRKLNRAADAKQLLEPIVTGARPLDVVVQEMGHIELESGNYEEAERWLSVGRAVAELSPDQLLPAAITSHLVGKQTRSRDMINRYESVAFRNVRMYDLQLRLSINSRDQESAAELQRLQAAPESLNQAEVSAGPAHELYVLHCGACHGTRGDGNGPASRHLFPPARDFQRDRFRMVSTDNGVPSLDDLERVIERGLPGTSMPSNKQLSRDERRLLATEVLRMYKEGLRRDFVERQREQGEEVSDEEIREFVERRTAPGLLVELPEIGPPTDDSIARGKILFEKLSCLQCHGDRGPASSGLALFNENGVSTYPRDFVHDPLKSGLEPKSLLRRILLGMPGTPHPSSPQIPIAQLVDLVQYCRSQATEPKRVLTNYQRRLRAEKGAWPL
jgi:tetratricopeptide (TPR) repeat protein